MKTWILKKSKAIVLAVLLFLFCPMGLFAQKLITFKSGLAVRANIVSQTEDSLCYQALDNLNIINCVPKWMVGSIDAATFSPKDDGKNYWDLRARRSAKATMAGGIMLGVGILGSAGSLAAALQQFPASPDSDNSGYAVLFVASSLCAVSGVVITIAGGINLGVAKSHLRKVNLEIDPNPAISGVTVRLKF